MTPAFNIELKASSLAPAIEAAVNAWRAAHPAYEVNIVAGSGNRTAAENARIARTQAGLQRNPYYLPGDTLKVIKGLVAAAASDRTWKLLVLKQVGEIMRDAVRQNILRQANRSGSKFRSLTEAYAAYKQRKHGFVTPILRATGELMDSLGVEVRRA